MCAVKIRIHSAVDLITNSSTELFTLKTDLPRYIVKEMLYQQCVSERAKEWFNSELSVYEEDGYIVVYSFLNSPDWFYDFLNDNFTIENYEC